mgnify:CR=1 FL=1
MSDPTPSARALALAEEASFDFAIGDEAGALAKLAAAVAADPACFEAWLAKAEVHFAAGQYDEALAAGEQGKFYEMHDKLFENQQNLSRADFEKYAQELGLDMGKFKAALDSGKFKAQVDAAKKSEAEGLIGEVREALKGEDQTLLKEKGEALARLMSEIGTAAYQQGQAEGADGAESGEATPAGEETIEGEAKEV